MGKNKNKQVLKEKSPKLTKKERIARLEELVFEQGHLLQQAARLLATPAARLDHDEDQMFLSNVDVHVTELLETFGRPAPLEEGDEV